MWPRPRQQAEQHVTAKLRRQLTYQPSQCALMQPPFTGQAGWLDVATPAENCQPKVAQQQ